MFTDQQIEELRKPLMRSHVRQRTQAGRQLSYIEGWHAIAEANRIFGFDSWDRTLVMLDELGQPREVDGKWRVAYIATVRITIHGDTTIVRDGTGYGSGIDRDIGSAHESAVKEAETDAMKRALITFGNPFGLALYDKDQGNVADGPDLSTRIRDEMIGVIATKDDEISLRAYLSSADAKASYKSLDDAGRAAVNKATADAKARILASLPMAGE